MDALQKVKKDVNILFNITDILTQHLRYHQMYTYVCNILAYLMYMRKAATHTMDYLDAATTNILSPDILPADELRSMLRHIECQLPIKMHLPISLDDTLHFYQYL